LGQNGRVDGFHNVEGAVVPAAILEVKTRSHIRIQLPAWRELECQLSGNQHTQKSKQDDDEDNQPIPSLVLNFFHGIVR
jgi:hypothetical protein